MISINNLQILFIYYIQKNGALGARVDKISILILKTILDILNNLIVLLFVLNPSSDNFFISLLKISKSYNRFNNIVTSESSISFFAFVINFS